MSPEMAEMDLDTTKKTEFSLAEIGAENSEIRTKRY
jgi:hypothetical protein